MQDSQKQPTQTKEKTPPPKFTFKLESNGDLEFDGEIDSESLDLLLQRAEYYRSKDKENKQEVVEVKQQIDSITMTFIGVVLTIVTFGTYSVVSDIAQSFKAKTTVTSNVQVVPQILQTSNHKGDKHVR